MIDESLLSRLERAIEAMGLNRLQLGFPEMVVKEVQNAEKLFNEYSKAKPSTQDAYKVALGFLRGDPLDDWSANLIAAVVAIPIKEFKDLTVIESARCDELFARYENEANQGELLRLTWYYLLNSYLNFDLKSIKSEAGRSGFSKLRKLLGKTWPSIDRASGKLAVPDWVRVLRLESQLLTDKPVEKYVNDYLVGKTESVHALVQNLGIPNTSWFWSEFVTGVIRHVADQNDEAFRSQILMIIELIKSFPVYRDRAIAEVLVRYQKCTNRAVHPELRDYVISGSVWRNPKLKAAGIATAWNQVPEDVWRMVMGWVNERNLRDFFDILATRRHSDHGRLKFWSRYMNQITWTRLVFGAETLWLKHNNKGIRDLLDSEEGTYASLKGVNTRELDAFLMQIAGCVIVEFSKTGNGCYGYAYNDLPFNAYADTYSGGTDDLRMGYYPKGKRVLKIAHTPGWEDRAEVDLRRLGIHPDQQAARQEPAPAKLTSQQLKALNGIKGLSERQEFVPSTGMYTETTQKPSTQTFSQPRGAIDETPDVDDVGKSDEPISFSIEVLRELVKPYGATVRDIYSSGSRRWWVMDPSGSIELGKKLKTLGFKWSNSREGYFLVQE